MQKETPYFFLTIYYWFNEIQTIRTSLNFDINNFNYERYMCLKKENILTLFCLI